MKIEFETFKDLSRNYFLDQIKQTEPDNINFLSYRKYKIIVELVEESKLELIERLDIMLKNEKAYNRRDGIIKEIVKLNK